MRIAPLARLAAALGAILLLSSCDCAGNDPTEAPDPGESPPAPEEPPAAQPSAEEAEPVTFRTPDGVTIHGSLRSSADPAGPAVILVHQLGATRGEWAPIVERLSAAPGLTTLAIDMRGHGESLEAEGAELSWHDFDNEQWAMIVEDVRAAIAFIRDRYDVPPSRIALVGSSIGSSAILLAAVDEPGAVALVAISPGRAYRGLDAITPTTELGDRPFLAIAAEEELPAVEAARDMARIAAAGELELYGGGAHGLAILETSPQMADRVDAFLRQALGVGSFEPGAPGSEPMSVGEGDGDEEETE